MTDEQVADLLMPCRRAIALAAAPIDKIRIIQEESAKLAKLIHAGELDRCLLVDAVYESAGALIDIVGENPVMLAVETGLRRGLANGCDVTEGEITPTAYVAPNPADIKPRQWLHGKHYIRGCVTATIAPGGHGKTTLALREAIMMAQDGYRVWYISGEDDRVELDRRIAAHLISDGKSDIKNLFVDDRSSLPFKIAFSTKNGVEFDSNKIEAFERAIERVGIDAIILDPWVSFHCLPESDNMAMDMLVKRLGEICFRRQCSIELSHHVRKPSAGQFEITVFDARGAGAMVNAVRSCRVLNQMNDTECDQAQIKPEYRKRYIRIDDGKQNMAPAEAAKWIHIISVELPNGDNVQAMEEWEFPKIDVITDDDISWLKSILKGNDYRADSRSPDWLGIQVARHFGRDVTVKGDVVWINTAIKKWISAGIIKKEEREDEHRHLRSYYILMEE